jgi:hypothetical protein
VPPGLAAQRGELVDEQPGLLLRPLAELGPDMSRRVDVHRGQREAALSRPGEPATSTSSRHHWSGRHSSGSITRTARRMCHSRGEGDRGPGCGTAGGGTAGAGTACCGTAA